MSVQNIGTSGRVKQPGESFISMVSRKSKENPLVPLGTVATCFALFMAFQNTRRGNSKTMNYWLRARIGAQFFTVVALVGGTYYINNQNSAKKAQEEAEAAAEREREKLAFEERLKAAEEAHRLEEEAAKARSVSSSSSNGRGWGWFGRS
ncbi:hypothetical protein QCA50_019006 [Cerrena zonata]|uniref:HIG1 domain-containing protein n=1 Tax=Cerrena zonata TaxID=2478898 RepID=A0AAW0FG46_9APHY